MRCGEALAFGPRDDALGLESLYKFFYLSDGLDLNCVIPGSSRMPRTERMPSNTMIAFSESRPHIYVLRNDTTLAGVSTTAIKNLEMLQARM